jgi:hypothetical protein
MSSLSFVSTASTRPTFKYAFPFWSLADFAFTKVESEGGDQPCMEAQDLSGIHK